MERRDKLGNLNRFAKRFGFGVSEVDSGQPPSDLGLRHILEFTLRQPWLCT